MSWAMNEYQGMLADVAIERERGRAEDAIGAARDWQAYANNLQARLEESQGETAGNLAIRYALQGVIQAFAPDHPLLADANLRSRIVEAGATALRLTNNWDAAREAGRTFTLPEYTFNWTANSRVAQIVDEHVATKRELEQTKAALKAANAELMEARRVVAKLNTLQEQRAEMVRDCAHHMAQSAAFRSQLEVVDPENPLVVDAQLRRRVADLGYNALVTTGKWESVREVGRTILRSRQVEQESRARLSARYAAGDEVVHEAPEDEASYAHHERPDDLPHDADPAAEAEAAEAIQEEPTGKG